MFLLIIPKSKQNMKKIYFSTLPSLTLAFFKVILPAAVSKVCSFNMCIQTVHNNSLPN